MNWTKGCRCLVKVYKTTRDISRFGAPFCNTGNQDRNVILRNATEVRFLHSLQPQREFPPDVLILRRNVSLKAPKLPFFQGSLLRPRPSMMTRYRLFGECVGGDTNLRRDLLAQLWVADRKMKKAREKKSRVVEYDSLGETVYSNQPTGAAVTEEKSCYKRKPVLRQPPVSQSLSGFLEPASSEEIRVAPLLARSNLLITRDIEWANLVLGFEQENRYAIVDVCYPETPVGLIREQSNLIARQLLRLRRPFIAYITDATGHEFFRVRRPFWWITSSIYAEIDGKEVGMVHRRWHLWRRVYDLYVGNKQFAVVENPGFWNWTFTLKGINGEVLAQIDRDWRGFGFEIFTDAGQYIIRFGAADPSSKTGLAEAIQELEVTRLLTLAERAVTVALAISLDNDYFSRHGGWGIPFVEVGE
ncbi:Scramblase domain-containing protein [Cephalotus follicularis]|uniref:Phospholipid scramblase n=1 Tax=Cephalotus follicularis TaxID=3775 RepID=A0A1Q3DFV4_CEPFO|nr:Scramblase domain-containing protein [Cephalotus follicularis]